jgi:hypothetical protein
MCHLVYDIPTGIKGYPIKLYGKISPIAIEFISGFDGQQVMGLNFPQTKKALQMQSLYVGAARFELTTSWSQTRRDTGLRYAPSF